MRNRLPNSSDKSDKRTAYEIMNDVSLPVDELIDHFRTIGCICYVVIPHNTYTGKPKVSFRAMMMGYSDHEGKKGYKVRRLSDGKMMSVAYERVYRFHEMSFAYPPSPEHDAWLRKSVKKRDKGVHIMREDEKECEEKKESEIIEERMSKEVTEVEDDESDDSPPELNLVVYRLIMMMMMRRREVRMMMMKMKMITMMMTVNVTMMMEEE